MCPESNNNFIAMRCCRKGAKAHSVSFSNWIGPGSWLASADFNLGHRTGKKRSCMSSDQSGDLGRVSLPLVFKASQVHREQCYSNSAAPTGIWRSVVHNTPVTPWWQLIFSTHTCFPFAERVWWHLFDSQSLHESKPAQFITSMSSTKFVVILHSNDVTSSL